MENGSKIKPKKTICNSHSYILDVNQNQATIDVANYQTGVYNVILVCNGQAVDASTLVVQ